LGIQVGCFRVSRFHFSCLPLTEVLAVGVYREYSLATTDSLPDAGGVPVEIASGTGGLAYSYFIGRRRGYGTELVVFKPSNVR
jgi:ammonia channel protein AmtB